MAFISNPQALEERYLSCVITLQSGTFAQGGNTKVIDNNTINAVVTKTLSNNFTNSADITIYGMNDSDIAALSTLGYLPFNYNTNKITLYANYVSQPKSLCFVGYIVRAWCDYSDPSRPMHFQCQKTYLDAIASAKPINIQGSSSVPGLFSTLASSLGLSLNNNGVTGLIKNAIFDGSLIDQCKSLAKQTSNNCVLDNYKMYIAPLKKSLSNLVLQLDSSSGLIGYPTIDAMGIKLKMRYNPVLHIGQYIQLSSKVPKTTGKWYVYDMTSSLNNRHENWYTDLRLSYNSTIF